jgi:hypothetical protein
MARAALPASIEMNPSAGERRGQVETIDIAASSGRGCAGRGPWRTRETVMAGDRRAPEGSPSRPVGTDRLESLNTAPLGEFLDV